MSRLTRIVILSLLALQLLATFADSQIQFRSTSRRNRKGKSRPNPTPRRMATKAIVVLKGDSQVTGTINFEQNVSNWRTPLVFQTSKDTLEVTGKINVANNVLRVPVNHFDSCFVTVVIEEMILFLNDNHSLNFFTTFLIRFRIFNRVHLQYHYLR